jgi:hypothetical protein
MRITDGRGDTRQFPMQSLKRITLEPDLVTFEFNRVPPLRLEIFNQEGLRFPLEALHDTAGIRVLSSGWTSR